MAAALNFTITKGLDLPLVGAPIQSISVGAPIKSVALLGSDFLSLRRLPKVLVSEGQRVRLGEPLIQSKQHAAVVGVSPGCGVVERIIRGEKRSLRAITIRLDGDDQEVFNRYSPAALDTLTSRQVRENLIVSGMWLALRTRPYSVSPAPDSEPDAIFVTAMDTQPLAPSTDVIISEARDDFVNGLEVISKLCQAKTYLCVAAGVKLPERCTQLAAVARFTGPHPAGLVGTHIHRLFPVDASRVVWHINYQDVIAIGRLFVTGNFSSERIVALSGPLMKQPRLVRTRIGASLVDLLDGALNDGNARVVSGSVLTGRHGVGWAAYLGWFHHQVTALKESRERELLGWIAPGLEKFSALRVFASHVRGKGKSFDMDAGYHGKRRAMVPIGVYERVMPLDVLITPLLRALLVGDIEAAIDLGCLELDEEDLALCSFVCPSKHDFGSVLREMLDRIQRDG